MYSVKPGRGPSFMGIFGGIIAAVIGIAFASQATAMEASPVALYALSWTFAPILRASTS